MELFVVETIRTFFCSQIKKGQQNLITFSLIIIYFNNLMNPTLF